MPAPDDRRRRITSLACYGAMAYSVVFSIVFISRLRVRVGGQTYFTLFDDAMVSMRYGFNLAHGHGLVYNAGQHPVEGFTNLSWTLWMAAVQALRLPLRFNALAVMASAAVLVAAAVWVSGGVARRLAPTSVVARPVAMWLVALYYPLSYWSLMGMEVGLLALLTLSAVLLAMDVAEGHRPGAWLPLALVLALAVLTREDALVVAVVVVGYVGIRRGLRQGLLVASGPVLALAGHLLFSAIYYGSALPNTYYLKIGGVSLGTRVSRGLASLVNLGMWELWVPVLLALWFLFASRRRRQPACWLIFSVVVAQCAYVVYVGGDAWDFTLYADRFMATVMPALLVLCGLAIASIVEQRTLKLAHVAIVSGGVLLVLALRAVPFQPGKVALALQFVDFARWRIGVPLVFLVVFVATGLWLALVGRRHRAALNLPLLALVLTGVVAFATVGREIDLWGQDNAYPYALMSDYVRYGVALGASTAPGTTIAMTAAGAAAYFAQRPVVDMLGKSDPVVAREKPKLPYFLPGHNKWDYAYSVKTLRPEVVAMLWMPTPQDLHDMGSWGYVEAAPGLFIRSDAQGVDRAGVTAAGLTFGRAVRQGS